MRKKPPVHYAETRWEAIKRARKCVEDDLAATVKRKEPRPWLVGKSPGAYGNRGYYSAEIHVLEGSPQRGFVIVLNGSEFKHETRLVYAFDAGMNRLAEFIINPDAEQMEKWERDNESSNRC